MARKMSFAIAIDSGDADAIGGISGFVIGVLITTAGGSVLITGSGTGRLLTVCFSSLFDSRSGCDGVGAISNIVDVGTGVGSDVSIFVTSVVT